METSVANAAGVTCSSAEFGKQPSELWAQSHQFPEFAPDLEVVKLKFFELSCASM